LKAVKVILLSTLLFLVISSCGNSEVNVAQIDNEPGNGGTTVGPQPEPLLPQVSCFLSSAEGTAPLDVNLSVTLSGESNSEVSCKVDFDGDGNPELEKSCQVGEEEEFSFRYDNPGTYEAKLIIYDNFGQKVSYTFQITVNEAESSIPPPSPPPIFEPVFGPPSSSKPTINCKFDGNYLSYDSGTCYCSSDPITIDGETFNNYIVCSLNFTVHNSGSYTFKPVSFLYVNGQSYASSRNVAICTSTDCDTWDWGELDQSTNWLGIGSSSWVKYYFDVPESSLSSLEFMASYKTDDIEFTFSCSLN